MTLDQPWRSLRQRLRAAGLPLALAGALGTTLLSLQASQAQTPAATSSPGARGAQVYCFLRTSGNDHQVSWDAAYAVIKRQSDRLFKTSPSHAAVLITETVVQNPDAYPDCSRYIGDLYRKPESKPRAAEGNDNRSIGRSERYNQ